MINHIQGMNKKVVGAIIVAVVILAGIVLYENLYSWKTYTNSIYGYSLQYPSTWKLETYDGGINIISPKDQKLLKEADKTGDHLGIQDELDIFNISAYPYSERAKHLTHWKQESVVLNGKSVEKITAYGPDSSSQFVQLINGGIEYAITFPTDEVRTKIFESFQFRTIKKLEDSAYWKTYKNEKYGFELKYPEIYNVFSFDSVIKKHSLATPQADNLFITSATEYQLNNVGREYGGIWFTVSDQKIEEPREILSKKEIDIGGVKGTEYETSGGVEHTGLTIIQFQKDGRYYQINEWSTRSLLSPFISNFKFTSPKSVTSLVDKTNWKTYIDKDKRFTFQYPSDWKVHITADLPDTYPQQDQIEVVSPEHEQAAFSGKETSYEAVDFSFKICRDTTKYCTSLIKVDAANPSVMLKPGIRGAAGFAEHFSFTPYYEILVPNFRGKSFMIDFPSAESREKMTPIQNQILSSIKFTALADIISPNGGEVISVNKPITVTFKPVANAAYSINLVHNDRAAVLTSFNSGTKVIGQAVAQQDFTVTVPENFKSSIPPGNDYKIELCSDDGDCDYSDNYFTLTN